MADNLIPPKITLDSYQDLINQAALQLEVITNGVITASTNNDSTFLRPYFGTMAFVGSELLFKANLAAQAAALSFLSSVVNIPENLGIKAVTTLQFGLSISLTNNFLIPAGFQVSDNSGTIRFYTDFDLIIQAGAIAAQVTATAEDIGTKYNLGIGQIVSVSQPLAYLSYVTNIEACAGGSDPQTSTDLIISAANALSNRNPVSAKDFENFAVSILGIGSRAKAIGLLAADKITTQLGVVHLFLLSSNGVPITDAEAQSFGETLSPRLMLGTQLIISPMELYDIRINLIGTATGEKNITDIQDQCWLALTNYFSPSTFTVGGTILLEELKYVLRSVGGFIIEIVEINDNAISQPLPNLWTLPNIILFQSQLVDQSGNVFNDVKFLVDDTIV